MPNDENVGMCSLEKRTSSSVFLITIANENIIIVNGNAFVRTIEQRVQRNAECS